MEPKWSQLHDRDLVSHLGSELIIMGKKIKSLKKKKKKSLTVPKEL